MSDSESQYDGDADKNPANGILSFLLAVDWSEPWLCAIVLFHVLNCVLLTVLMFFERQNLQIVLFLLYLSIVYCAEYINEWASQNYRRFANQQYFDDKGMFISLILSTPLLINCFVLVICWVWTSMQTMIKLKRRKLIAERKAQEQNKNK